MKHYIFLASALALGIANAFSQTNKNSASLLNKNIFHTKNERLESNKNKFFVHWGYNISAYAPSDIHFTGPGYDFTLHNVKAKDRPTKFGIRYADPSRISIPQFNFHFGYFISDKYSLSVGWDHMKYVVDIPQLVKISGYIDSEISNPGIPTGDRAGVYDGDIIQLDGDMLTFEHTDGYNFAALGLERYDDIIVNTQGKQVLTLQSGVEAGLIVPRSDVRLFGVGDNHYWNISGYGGAAKVGIQYHIYKGWYVQSSFKTGYTELLKIPTTGRKGIDKAQQGIWFFENFWVVGFRF